MPQSLSQGGDCRPSVFRDLLIGGLLLGALLIFYHPALHGGLVFDDDHHITPAALRSVRGLWRIWFEPGAAAQYYPVVHTAFWIEYRLWGDALAGYHLANLGQHAAAAFLLVAILRRLALPAAWLAASVFALHPICVESVAWISEQKNTLSALFYFGAMLAYLRFDKNRRGLFYAVAFVLFLLALLSKSVTATLPGALLVIFWWQRGRLEWKRDVMPLLPWFVAGAAAGLFTGWVERTYFGADDVHLALAFPDRLVLAGRIFWFYPGKILWPANLMFHYPFGPVEPLTLRQFVWPLGVIAAAAGLACLARRARGPLAAFLFYAGTLFPVLGFLNISWFSFSYVADHFVYLAGLGIIVPVVVGCATAVGNIPGKWIRLPAWGGAGIALLVLSTLTWRQCQMYRDMETFYKVTLAGNPGSALGHYNYGIILMKVPGRLPDALSQFEEALRLRPDDAVMQNGTGVIFLSIKGRQAEAAECFERAVRLKPDYAVAHVNLGTALESVPGRESEARAHYETALRIDPRLQAARKSLERLREKASDNRKL